MEKAPRKITESLHLVLTFRLVINSIPPYSISHEVFLRSLEIPDGLLSGSSPSLEGWLSNSATRSAPYIKGEIRFCRCGREEGGSRSNG